MSVGFTLFLFGVAQVYTAKFRKTGLVNTGLYRKIRHPQYIALVLFGVGTLTVTYLFMDVPNIPLTVRLRSNPVLDIRFATPSGLALIWLRI